MSTSTTSERAGWLTVRVTRILGGEAGRSSRVSVFCPFEALSKPMEECRACPFCDGIAPDARGRPGALLCSRDLGEAPGPVGQPGTGTDPVSTPLGAALRTETLCVRPETSAEAVADLFLSRGIGSAPVLDEDGRILGIITRTDLLRDRHDSAGGGLEEKRPKRQGRKGLALDLEPGSHAFDPSATAADLMTPAPMALPDRAPISQAAALMAFEGIHHVPVVDADRRLVGLLSSLDVVRWMARASGYKLPDRTRRQPPDEE